MGCSSALRLAQAGAEVLVLERSVPGAEASSAAAGILAPAFEAAHVAAPTQVVPFGIESRTLYASLAEELREDHGVDIGHRRCGAMAVAFEGEDHLNAIEHRLAEAPGAVFERLDGSEALQREPSLAAVAGAIDFPDAAQVDPKRLLPALALAAERAGAVFRTGAVVHAIEDGPRVVLGTETLDADHVIVAAGSWTGLIAGLDLGAARIAPVRGQIVRTTSRPPLFRRVVFGAGGYVLTRPDGEVLCGSTEEHVGFRKEVTFRGLETILHMAQRVCPRLGQSAVLGHWASFRPGTADDLPLIGPAGPKGVWLASGHYRNGILQAPMTADLLTRALTGTAPSPFAKLVDPRRFAPERARGATS